MLPPALVAAIDWDTLVRERAEIVAPGVGPWPWRSSLRLLLEKRFGPLSEAHLGHLSGASDAALERWVERALSARTVDDVFADD